MKTAMIIILAALVSIVSLEVAHWLPFPLALATYLLGWALAGVMLWRAWQRFAPYW